MPIPSLQLQKKTCLMQRSRGFGHGVAVSKICYNAVIVLSVVLCDCCRPINSCRDWVFSNSGLEAKLPVLQLPMFAKCDALPKGDLLFTWTLQRSINLHPSMLSLLKPGTGDINPLFVPSFYASSWFCWNEHFLFFHVFSQLFGFGFPRFHLFPCFGPVRPTRLYVCDVCTSSQSQECPVGVLAVQVHQAMAGTWWSLVISIWSRFPQPCFLYQCFLCPKDWLQNCRW